jgi:hypothetical protein
VQNSSLSVGRTVPFLHATMLSDGIEKYVDTNDAGAMLFRYVRGFCVS